jgi:hypothetical protein
MRYLYDLKDALTTWADDWRTIEIEKKLVTIQASALYAELHIGHCD